MKINQYKAQNLFNAIFFASVLFLGNICVQRKYLGLWQENIILNDRPNGRLPSFTLQE